MKEQSALIEHVSPKVPTMYMAFELADRQWKLAFTEGIGDDIDVRTIEAREINDLIKTILEVKEQRGLEDKIRLRSIYEAGFDSFWLHRKLSELGVENLVVDAASIEVNRRGRRRKTDRLDVRHLVRKLVQYHMGDHEVFCVCAVPSRQQASDRRAERERQQLNREKTALSNRLKGLFKTHGLKVKIDADLINGLDELECRDGSRLLLAEKAEIRRAYQRLELVEQQLGALVEQIEQRAEQDDAIGRRIRKLCELKGIGLKIAYGLVVEMFGWREFRNRDQVSSYAGYDSAPYDTGQTSGKSQGISKAGNRWVRAVMHSAFVNWLRWQPDSHLTQWYRKTYDDRPRGERCKGQVALSRKLLVRLWRWIESDELPWGADVRTA